MKIDFDKYQDLARSTAVYPFLHLEIKDEEVPSVPRLRQIAFVYPAMGLAGEAGEVNEKLKKVIRDKQGDITPEIMDELKKELGDVLWYVANLAYELGLSLNDVAVANVNKLKSRKNRNKLHGSGDNR